MSQDNENPLLEDKSTSSEAEKTETKPVEEPTSKIYKTVLGSVLKLSSSFTISFLTSNIFLILLNNQDPAVQGAVSLGISIMNIFGSAVFVSINYGLMSRLAHAYGAKNYRLMGLYLHRGLIINLITAFVSIALVYFSPDLFAHFGFDQDLVTNMKEFISIAVVQFIFIAISQVYRSYIQSLAKFNVAFWTQILSCSVAIALSFVLIRVLNMGVQGVAISMIAQRFISSLVTMLYCFIANPAPGTLFKFCKDSFKGLWELTKYIFMAGGQMFLDWIGYEIMTLLSGTLIVAECDALVLSLNFYALIGGSFAACNVTVSAYVGAFIGAKQIKTAKRYAKAAMTICMTYLLIGEILIFCFTDSVVQLYTQSSEVQGYMINTIRLLMIVALFDAIGMVCGAIIRALKLEKLAVAISFVSTYVVAIPLAFILVLCTDMGVYGIMCGCIAMVSLSSIAYVFSTFRFDWNKQAENVAKALEADNTKIEKKEERNESEVKGISSDE